MMSQHLSGSPLIRVLSVFGLGSEKNPIFQTRKLHFEHKNTAPGVAPVEHIVPGAAWSSVV
jgi:hypothetical protein